MLESSKRMYKHRYNTESKMMPPINLHGRLLLQNLYGKQGKVKSKKVFHLNTSRKNIIITKFYPQANKTDLRSIFKKKCSCAAYQKTSDRTGLTRSNIISNISCLDLSHKHPIY
jgi:hypothetical protein